MLSTSMLVVLPLGQSFWSSTYGQKMSECQFLPDIDNGHGQSQVESLQLRRILSGPNRETRGGGGGDLIG